MSAAAKMQVHFSSVKSEWETPLWFFDQLDAEFKFNTYVCALPENAKCLHYYTPASGFCYEYLWRGRPELDAFAHNWKGVCYMNPPYGRGIGRWIKKAHESRVDGATVVCLLPARTDTAWWHDFVKMGEIRFLRGRLKFSGHSSGAPFPSAVVIFRP